MINFMAFIYNVPAIIIAMTIHGYSQAAFTVTLGDDTPKTRGRLTPNPLKHIEIIGFCLALFFGYGWCAPIETNAFRYKDSKKGTLITNTAPTLINLIIGIVCVIVRRVYIELTGADAISFVILSLYALAAANVHIALFNLIPIYPCDGYRILNLYLSPNARVKVSNYEKVLQIILMVLLVTGILGMILNFISGFIIY